MNENKDGNIKILLVLCLVAAVVSFQQVTQSLFGNIMNSYSDVPRTTISLIQTLPTLVGTFASFAVGPLAIKFSKKVLLMIGMSAVLAYCLIFMTVGGNGPLWLLFAGAATIGISSGFSASLINLFVNQYFNSSKRARYIAMTSACQQGGPAIITMLGGFLASGNNGANWPHAYRLGLILIPIMILFMIIMPGDSRKASEKISANNENTNNHKEKVHMPIKVLLLILMKSLFLCGMAGFSMNYSNFIIREYQLGTSVESGMVGTIFLMTGMIGGFGYPLFEKIFKNKISVAAYASSAIGMFIMIMSTSSLTGVFVAAVLLRLGMTLTASSVMSIIMEESPKELVSVSVSLAMGMMNIGSFVSVYVLSFFGGLLGGRLIDNIIVGNVILVIVVILSVFLTLKPSKAADTAKQ